MDAIAITMMQNAPAHLETQWHTILNTSVSNTDIPSGQVAPFEDVGHGSMDAMFTVPVS